MKYAKLTNNIVVQVQLNEGESFIECPDSVVCGMINNDGNYENPPQTAEQARTKKHDKLRINAVEASKEPVAAIGSMWNGGEDSRTRMNDKATYMEQAGVTEGISWDIANIEHTISDVEARTISNAITEQIESVGLHYRRKKNEYLACGDDTECINAVVW